MSKWNQRRYWVTLLCGGIKSLVLRAVIVKVKVKNGDGKLCIKKEWLKNE